MCPRCSVTTTRRSNPADSASCLLPASAEKSQSVSLEEEKEVEVEEEEEEEKRSEVEKEKEKEVKKIVERKLLMKCLIVTVEMMVVEGKRETVSIHSPTLGSNEDGKLAIFSFPMW